MKKRKHKKLIDDYEGQKRKHLEKLATKSLENDEKMLIHGFGYPLFDEKENEWKNEHKTYKSTEHPMNVFPPIN